MSPTLLESRLLLPVDSINENPLSIEIYGDPADECDDLMESIRREGVLVPLVVVQEARNWLLISGHRRLACARALRMREVPCEIRDLHSELARQQAVLEYNRQRRKTFRQLMREADRLEAIASSEARHRQRANLRQFDQTECRNSDARTGRTDSSIARALGLGGKDLYRQARTLWRSFEAGDPRAQAAVRGIEAGTKTIHAAYKDLRRRDRFAADFKPTPYDVWSFRHDPAFGIPHPGSIPPSIVAHTLHYYTEPGDLVVDPFAGGGTTADVCETMDRRCLAYDLSPVRPEIIMHDVRLGFTSESRSCSLIFCDPPYHTMLARRYGPGSLAEEPLGRWIAFLQQLGRDAFATLKPGGVIALLLANQTEKDLPAGHGYLDHAFLGYEALRAAGFLPERRVSCPMSGAYLPQHVRRARTEGRMLGQVRDLLIMRKPR